VKRERLASDLFSSVDSGNVTKIGLCIRKNHHKLIGLTSDHWNKPHAEHGADIDRRVEHGKKQLQHVLLRKINSCNQTLSRLKNNGEQALLVRQCLVLAPRVLNWNRSKDTFPYGSLDLGAKSLGLTEISVVHRPSR